MKVPTLIVVGAEDGLAPPAEADKLRSAIPGARLEVIQRAGHLSALEQPELFNSAVLGFIDSLPQ